MSLFSFLLKLEGVSLGLQSPVPTQDYIFWTKIKKVNKFNTNKMSLWPLQNQANESWAKKKNMFLFWCIKSVFSIIF